MINVLNVEELTQTVGDNIRALRLQKNLTQEALAAQAGVSLSALRHLESGQGANLTTLIRVVRALDRQEWLQALAPQITINPLHMTPTRGARQRARGRRKQRTHGQAS
ncbi:MAG: helix-turn-helix transcriptional regulator [Elusimicrobia bacterium]|nr:helix-turn-helix transcriptional regulator [Elusimicrobiota bacterium]